MEQLPMLKAHKFYLSKDKTGLPFHIVKDEHFQNYFARHDNGKIEKLSISDIVNIHLLISIKTLNDGE